MKKPDDFLLQIKSEKRSSRRKKERYSPAGGSWAGQAKRAHINRNYEGLPPSLIPKIKVRIKKKKK